MKESYNMTINPSVDVVPKNTDKAEEAATSEAKQGPHGNRGFVFIRNMSVNNEVKL